MGSYYLSIQCGASAQQFRAVAFEIRGRLEGSGDAVHGEICPEEYIYHSLAPTFDVNISDSNQGSSGGGSGSHRRRGLAGLAAPEACSPGDHVQLPSAAGDEETCTLLEISTVSDRVRAWMAEPCP